MRYLQSSVLIPTRTSTAPTKKKVVETKFRCLKVPFLLRGITKYFLQILSFHFCPFTVYFEFDDTNFTPRMTFSKIELMYQGAKIFHPVPLKSLYARAREVKMISLATHPSKNLLPVIVICSRAEEKQPVPSFEKLSL